MIKISRCVSWGNWACGKAVDKLLDILNKCYSTVAYTQVSWKQKGNPLKSLILLAKTLISRVMYIVHFGERRALEERVLELEKTVILLSEGFSGLVKVAKSNHAAVVMQQESIERLTGLGGSKDKVGRVH